MNTIIRIVSFQNAQNYGAILQAFGLMKTIEGLGYKNVAFLNYNPAYLRNRYKVLSKRFFDTSHYPLITKFKFWLSLPIIIVNRLRRNAILNKSRKHLLRQTQKIYRNVDDIRNVRCDLLICGSDQIWSTWITGNPDPVFYGIGDYDGIRKKISYAASTEISTFEKEEAVILIKEYLRELDSISVREVVIRDRIKSITGRDVSLCIDPTLLCGVEAFSNVANRRLVKSRYILVYSYDLYDRDIHSIIKTIPSYEDYQIHYLSFGSTGLSGTFNKYIHGEVSVENFLSYFKYADYVVTNSFHGLAFALLFEKPFNVSYKTGLSTRVESLLEQLSLSQRLVKNVNEVYWNEIDYSLIREKLNSIRADSLNFLKNIIEDLSD